MESPLSISKLGTIKLGPKVVERLSLDPLTDAIVETVLDLQSDFPEHSIWLVDETISVWRKDTERAYSTKWSNRADLRDYCKMQTLNLLILADYLDTVQPTAFDMAKYAQDEHGEDLPLRAHECGTVCCAAGSGPAAGFAPEREDGNWLGYVERVFGLNSWAEPWLWCFASQWAWIDNTPAGAAKRIRYLVNNGVPKDAKDQRCGTARYIFNDASTSTQGNAPMKYFMATIDILVQVNTEDEACDAISETLRPLLKEFEPKSCVIDWRYSGGAEGSPEPHNGEGFEYA